MLTWLTDPGVDGMRPASYPGLVINFPLIAGSVNTVSGIFTLCKDSGLLSGIPLETLSGAIGFIIKTRSFAGNLPTVAEIREAANSQGESIESRIAIAWDKLQYALEHHGFYDSVKFDDPIIHHILTSLGGWRKWSGAVTTDEMKWVRKDFEALFRAYASQPLPPPVEYFPGEQERGKVVREAGVCLVLTDRSDPGGTAGGPRDHSGDANRGSSPGGALS
ncbi:MAG: DUF6475 domain-containing protein, partial [Syntrophales bacterium]|nr:DUF6475 domain-containing protein [Syntrophales bacterium]